MESKKKPLTKKIDLIVLLSILAVSIVYSGSVYAQGRRAEGTDTEIYINFGGLAFQCLPFPTAFIALYTPEGALNTTENDFYIGEGGGGKFTFTSNENFTLQFLKSVSANIEGDQAQGSRAISADETGLSGNYTVLAGDRVTIYWAPVLDYPFALPLISFWGFVGGSIISAMGLGGTIKKRNLKLLWLTIISAMVALVCFIIWINL